MHREYQYLNLVKKILFNGDIRKTRNSKTIKSIFGEQMKFDLRNNVIPILTTKKMAWKTCYKELLWFINGGIFNKDLQEQNVHIWDDNSSKEFLESRNLGHYNEEYGELGPIYGFQWRNFNGNYQHYLHNKLIDNMNSNNMTNKQQNKYNVLNKYYNNGVDQLQNVINILQNKDKYEDKYSRRLIISAWNPVQLNMMALPPCHVMFQFHVNSKDELSCSLYQRSGDIALGVPFNIISYSLLTHMIADLCNLKTGDFIHNLGDIHIYPEHEENMLKQLDNKPYEFPKIEWCYDNKPEKIEDYNLYSLKINNYKSHNKIKFEMIK